MSRLFLAVALTVLGVLFILDRHRFSREAVEDQNRTWSFLGFHFGEREVRSAAIGMVLLGVALFVAAVLILLGVLPV